MDRLTAHHLSCYRGGYLIFQDLEFSVSSGTLLHVKGANGAGKTSLLKMIAGLLPSPPHSFQWKKGRSVSEDTFFIGTRSGMKSFLTVHENLTFWSQIFKNSPQKIEEALDYFGLLPFKEMKVSALSQGQHQRLNLARLFLVSKPIWLLDEPFLSLDQSSQKQLRRLIQNHLSHRGLVILASHEDEPLKTSALNLETYRPQSSVSGAERRVS